MPFTVCPYRRFPVCCAVIFNAEPFLKPPLASISGFWLLITLLVLSSGPAYSEWVAVGGNEEAGVTVYADPGTIRRKGNLVKVWHLNDFKTVQIVNGISYLSVKAQHEYDCTKDRERILALMTFSGNMGSGKVVYKRLI